MLSQRDLPCLGGIDEYRKLFRFPVVGFYRAAGFDVDGGKFDIIAAEFIKLYRAGEDSFRLFPGAGEVLSAVASAGLGQVILSASEERMLRAQAALLGADKYFDEIIGISDIYGGGKAGAGLAYMKRAGAGRAVLVGDTVHDHETAQLIGADCLLIANGHQNAGELMKTGAPVLGDITDVLPVILREAII